MNSDRKGIEMSSIKVSEDSPDPGASKQDTASIIEKQTRTRRLFSMPQLFAFALVYLGTWYSVAMYEPLPISIASI